MSTNENTEAKTEEKGPADKDPAAEKGPDDKDPAADADDKNKNPAANQSKCDNPKVECPTAGLVKPLKAPAANIENMKLDLNKKVDELQDKLKTILLNPEKCFNNYKKSSPNFIDTWGASASKATALIGKATAQAINETLDALENVNITDVVMLSRGYTVAVTILQQKAQDFISQLLLGDNYKEIMAKNPDPEAVLKEMIAYQNDWKKALEKPVVKAELKKMLNEYFVSLNESFDLAKEPIDEFKGKLNDTIEGFGSNLGVVAGKSITNAIASATAAIPGVGAVVVAAKSGAELAEKITETCEPPLTLAAGAFNNVTMSVDKEVKKLNCKVDEFKAKIDPIFAEIQAASKITKAAPAAGGGGRSNTRRKNNIKQKIHNTTQRITTFLRRLTKGKGKGTTHKVHKTNYIKHLTRRRF